MEVIVRDNNVDHALRTLKRRCKEKECIKMKREEHMKSHRKKLEKSQSLREDGKLQRKTTRSY